MVKKEAVKLPSGILSRAEESTSQSQQPKLSRSSSATSTNVPTFQQPPAPAAREYVLHIPDTQMKASQAIPPVQQSLMALRAQQQPRAQAGTSIQLHFTISPTKHFNPPPVASVTGEESAHNISGLSSILGSIQSVMYFPKMDTP